MAALAGLSTFDPTLVLTVGPFVACVVFLFGRPGRLRITPSVLLAIALLAWIWLSVSWSVNPAAGQSTIMWAALLIIFIATVDYIQTLQQLRLVATGYLVGAFFAVAQTIFENQAAEGARVGVEGLNVNYLAYALASGFALIVLLWMTGPRTKRARVALLVVLVSLAVGVELAGTRGALLGVGLVAVWLVLCWAARRPPLKALVVALLVVCVLMISGVSDKASLVFEGGDRATGDWSGRLVLWPLARQIWAQHPLAGIGMGGFHVESGTGIGAHNALLEVGVSLGLVGLLLFVALFWTTLSNGVGAVDARLRAVLLGAFLLASAPAYLSGTWESAPASWVVLAVFSRLAVLAPAPDPLSVGSVRVSHGRMVTQPR
ncbi:O-antigen ligase family protein [Cryobacterium cryoconiti]|nr:O-antigen ligase family protein [Cryobacterium cryoconiti]